MSTYILDLSDPETLRAILGQYLSMNMCPIQGEPKPEPMTEVVVLVQLPGGSTDTHRGRVVQFLSESEYLVQLDTPVEVARLTALTDPALAHGPEVGSPAQPPPTLGTQAETEFGSPAEPPPTLGEPEVGSPAEADGRPPLPHSEAQSRPKDLAPSAYSDAYKQVENATPAEKQKMARQGNKTARQLLIKDTSKNLHVFVLQNPKITLDEVAEYAKLPGLSKDALRMIAQNRSWTASKQVAMSVVRNPSTPTEVAVNLVQRLGPGEWRILAQSSGVKMPIQAQARRMLMSRGQK